MKSILMIVLMIMSSNLLAQSKVAVVKLIRGQVDVLTLGKTTNLKIDDWVEEGAVIKTSDKSFVKLIFIDKSQMNVGPNSEMKIDAFTGKDSGVIDLVKGKIRSQVTKDYLQMKDKDKSKLFIKTQNSIMGVRGTDFMISTNGKNTSTVLFEGEIVFNRLDEKGSLSSSKLEEIVDRGVRMFPGEFSVMEANRPVPTVPSLLNIQQREHLEKNQDFNSDRAPGNAGVDVTKSVVPEGLSGQVVSNDSKTLQKEVNDQAASQVKTPASSDPDGYIKGNLIKPANGSFVHIDSGVIIPPGPGSVLDNNSNTYIPGSDSGKVAADGTYIPPKNMEITDDGKILVAVTDDKGNVVVKEMAAPSPVHANFLTSGEAGRLPGSVPGVKGDIPLPQSGMDTRFTPTGGFLNVNDPTRATLEKTTIHVHPQ